MILCVFSVNGFAKSAHGKYAKSKSKRYNQL